MSSGTAGVLDIDRVRLVRGTHRERPVERSDATNERPSELGFAGLAVRGGRLLASNARRSGGCAVEVTSRGCGSAGAH